MRRAVPERPLRALLLLAACAPGPIVLGWIDSGLDDWQHPLPWSLAILVATLLLLRGELHPALLDEEPARRAARYSLFVPPLLLATAVMFPRTISWALLWALSLVLLYLLAFAYVPRVRIAALAVASTLSFGLVVLDPSVAWILAAPGVAWFALPALETSARARLALTADTEPHLIWPLSGLLACLVVGGGVFAGAAALLPSAQADYRLSGLLKTAGSPPILPPGPPPSIPWLELGALSGIVIVTLVLFARFLAGTRREPKEELDLPADTTFFGKHTRPSRRDRPRATSWTKSPRLALIERYLTHLARLGLTPRPSDTPALLLEGLPPEEHPRARQLAERFERARWSPEPVEASDLAAAEAEASAIEASWSEGRT
tara:strand:- start:351 stop:1475 length:1125 start_codon:yes stop_codon:yes gene_type:complete